MISKHLMLLFILNLQETVEQHEYFKTSYVIVYRLTEFCENRSGAFQNILCYCLSLRPLQGSHGRF